MGNNQQINKNSLKSNISTSSSKSPQNPSQIQSKTSSFEQDLRCPNNYPITSICTNPKCKFNALLCSQPPCADNHSSCSIVSLSTVTAFLQHRVDMQLELVQKMQNMEEKIMQTYQLRRRASVQGLFQSCFGKQQFEIVKTVFMGSASRVFTGKTASEFIWKLRQSNSDLAAAGDRMFKTIERKAFELAAELVKMEERTIQQYIEQVKLTLQPLKIQPRQQLTSPTFKSSILNPSQQEQINFIFQSLDHPKEIKCIFRASEHNFQSSAFHSVCKYTPHTLTLVQTSFGKVIGGYTPLIWSISNGFAPDSSQSSCLLFVNKKQKAKLIKPKKAIQCFPDNGPVFGAGADLSVSNRCNENEDSCINFPYSYQAEKEQQPTQSTWTSICGNREGRNFRIVEYQIFSVSW